MRAWLGASALVAAAAVLVACGAGGGSTAAPALATPTPIALPTTAAGGSAVPLAVPTAGSSSTQVLGSTVDAITGAVSTPAVVTAADGSQVIPVPLPSDSSNITGSFGVPAATQIPPGTTVNETMSSVSAAGLPPLSHARVALDNTVRLPILFLSLRFSSSVTLPKGPPIQVLFPLVLPSTLTYFVAFFDPLRPSLGWQYGYAGPATVQAASSGTQLVFASNPQPLTLAAFTSYYFAVYAQSPAAPVPTPAPVGVATLAPSPTPAPVVALPAALAFGGVGSSNAVTLTASESGYSGTFTATSSDCPSSGKLVASISGTSPTFTITPLAAGSCHVVLTGDRGQTTIVPLSVAQSSLGVTLPGQASPSPTPAVPFAVPTSLAVSVAGQTILTVGAAGVTSGPIFVTARDATIAAVNPTVWTSPLPAVISVSGVGAGSTVLIVSDGAATTPGVHTVSVPVTVGNPTGAITIPGFPSPSPLASPPIVTPAVAAPITSGTSATFTVTSGTTGYSGPIFAVANSPFNISVQPNVWTSPLPATFTVTAQNGPSTPGIVFSDNLGGTRFISVPVVPPAATLTAVPKSLAYTFVNQFQSVAIAEPYRFGPLYGAACAGKFVFSNALASWPSGFTAPANSVFGQSSGPTAIFFIQAIAGGGGTCTATFYDLANNVSVSVPLSSPP